MEANATLTAFGRTAMLGIVLLAAVCLASVAHPQSHSTEELAQRMTQPSVETNWVPPDRKRGFEQMLRLYEPSQGWELPDIERVPPEGRAVSPTDER